MSRKHNYIYTTEQERAILRYKHFMEIVISIMKDVNKKYSEISLQEIWTLVQNKQKQEGLDGTDI